MKCERSKFGTQYEYEECLASRRQRQTKDNGEAARLSAALAGTDDDGETDED